MSGDGLERHIFVWFQWSNLLALDLPSALRGHFLVERDSASAATASPLRYHCGSKHQLCLRVHTQIQIPVKFDSLLKRKLNTGLM